MAEKKLIIPKVEITVKPRPPLNDTPKRTVDKKKFQRPGLTIKGARISASISRKSQIITIKKKF